jgi:ATP-dependent Clp protease ATP-binding subunit ClpA
MFERFTDRARRVVVVAQEEARLLGHNYIGTEHILLGLMHEQEGVAAKVLEQLGISIDAVRTRVQSIIGEGGGAPSGHIPFTPLAKKVLELSLREALQLGHNYIGTEHILLGLIREGEGVGALVLVNLGADLPVVRDAVVQQLAGPRGGGRQMRVESSGFMRPRETPAAAKAAVEARRLAGGGAVGSQHYLLGLVQAQDSLAAKALADLGVTREALEAKLAELKPTGTSDETPEEAGARRIGLRVEGRLVMLEVDDPELAASLEKAMAARKLRIIKGTDPEAVGFPGLWSSVSRTVEDLTRRLGRMGTGKAAGRSPEPPDWRPPGWHEVGHAAVYWIVSTPDGPAGHFDSGPDTDRHAARAWLRGWLEATRPSMAAEEEESGEGCCALWAYVDRAGESFAMTSFGFGPDGPAGGTPVDLVELIDAAVADLDQPAA